MSSRKRYSPEKADEDRAVPIVYDNWPTAAAASSSLLSPSSSPLLPSSLAPSTLPRFEWLLKSSLDPKTQPPPRPSPPSSFSSSSSSSSSFSSSSTSSTPSTSSFSLKPQQQQSVSLGGVFGGIANQPQGGGGLVLPVSIIRSDSGGADSCIDREAEVDPCELLLANQSSSSSSNSSNSSSYNSRSNNCNSNSNSSNNNNSSNSSSSSNCNSVVKAGNSFLASRLTGANMAELGRGIIGITITEGSAQASPFSTSSSSSSSSSSYSSSTCKTSFSDRLVGSKTANEIGGSAVTSEKKNRLGSTPGEIYLRKDLKDLARLIEIDSDIMVRLGVGIDQLTSSKISVTCKADGKTYSVEVAKHGHTDPPTVLEQTMGGGEESIRLRIFNSSIWNPTKYENVLLHVLEAIVEYNDIQAGRLSLEEADARFRDNIECSSEVKSYDFDDNSRVTHAHTNCESSRMFNSDSFNDEYFPDSICNGNDNGNSSSSAISSLNMDGDGGGITFDLECSVGGDRNNIDSFEGDFNTDSVVSHSSGGGRYCFEGGDDGSFGDGGSLNRDVGRDAGEADHNGMSKNNDDEDEQSLSGPGHRLSYSSHFRMNGFTDRFTNENGGMLDETACVVDFPDRIGIIGGCLGHDSVYFDESILFFADDNNDSSSCSSSVANLDNHLRGGSSSSLLGLGNDPFDRHLVQFCFDHQRREALAAATAGRWSGHGDGQQTSNSYSSSYYSSSDAMTDE